VALLSSSPALLVASSVILATVYLLKVLYPGALALPFILSHLTRHCRSPQTIGPKRMERVSSRQKNPGFTQHGHVRVLSFFSSFLYSSCFKVTVSSSLTLKTYLACLPDNTFLSPQKLMAKSLPGVTHLSVATTTMASSPLLSK
jgi:hypothetical protein